MPRVKSDAESSETMKPKGQMTAFAFFLQLCREEYKRKHPEETVNFADFSRKCSERWKTMSEKEKRRFNQMEEEDKKRFKLEMSLYNSSSSAATAEEEEERSPKNHPPHRANNYHHNHHPSSSSSGVNMSPADVMAKKPRKKRKLKDPNAPKRSMSAFFWYCQDERPKVRGANPDFSVGEVAKELARRWGEISPSLKMKYDALAQKDRQRYDKAKKDYLQSMKNNSSSNSAPLSKEIIDSDESEDSE